MNKQQKRDCPACGQSLPVAMPVQLASAALHTLLMYGFGGWAAVGYLWAFNGLLVTLYWLSPAYKNERDAWKSRTEAAKIIMREGFDSLDRQREERQ